MELERLEIQETLQLENLYESDAIKFNKLKHTYFIDFFKKTDSYLDFLKVGSRHYAFQLPENIDEIFLKKENAPFFWLLESPLLIAAERLLNENSNGHKSTNRNEINKNFAKWVIAKEPSQKNIFASIIVKALKSSSHSQNFLDLIYYSLILIFEESFRNPFKAMEELGKAQVLVDESTFAPELKKELSYLIKLYKGFSLIVLGKDEEASTELSYAIDSKESSITAKFYFAYLSALQNHADFTKALIKEILAYDIDRLKYASDCSSIVMLNFFLNNPVFPYIVYYNEFSSYADYIQSELIESRFDTKKIVSTLLGRLTELKKCELDEYFTDETEKTIKFLYDICEQHSHSESIFLRFIADYINEKFHYALNDIQAKIKEKLYKNYDRVMSLYQKTIEESESLSGQYKHEVDEIISSLQKKLTTSIQQIEEYVKDTLWEIEERKKNINYQSSFDPATSFRNSMSYNVVVSIIVFIIGGIAGYFNNSDYFENDFYLMLSRVILTGVKWSSLTFVVGFFISAFISGLVIFDKSNEKLKLEKTALELQKQKEMSIDMLKKEAEQKQKALSEGYLERIESHKKKIEDIKKEKEHHEPLLLAEAEEQLAPFKEKLSPLYLK